MAYTIGHVVYGVNLQPPSIYDKNAVDAFEGFRDEIYELGEEELITVRYNGNGDQPVFFGVELGEIDEVNTVDGIELIAMMTPTLEQISNYGTSLAEFATVATPELYQAISAVAPRVFITWGSS